MNKHLNAIIEDPDVSEDDKTIASVWVLAHERGVTDALANFIHVWHRVNTATPEEIKETLRLLENDE